MEEILCVFLITYFSLLLVFHHVATSISHFLTVTVKFKCFSSNDIGLCCFLILALALSLFSMLMWVLWFNFILGLNCYFPLFWVKVMYDNEFKRKGKKFSQKKDSGLLCSFFCLISPV